MEKSTRLKPLKTFIFWQYLLRSSRSRPWTKFSSVLQTHTVLSGVYAVSAKAAICKESAEEPIPTLAEPTKGELTNLEEKKSSHNIRSAETGLITMLTAVKSVSRLSALNPNHCPGHSHLLNEETGRKDVNEKDKPGS